MCKFPATEILAWRLREKSSGMLASSGTSTGGMTIARLARLGVLFARFKAIRLRRWRRSATASAHCVTCAAAPRVDSSARSPPVSSGPGAGGNSILARLQALLVWIWVAFLLVVVAYATVAGEHALAKLDTLKVLAAYSTGVRRIVRPERAAPEADARVHHSSSATRVP
jgi:hypothetical protein